MESDVLNRLRRVTGKQTTRLTHYGRKTGKPHEVTIWFVLDGDRLYIGTANVKRQWVRNVQKTPQVKLSIGEETFEGTARFLTDRSEHERRASEGATCDMLQRAFLRIGWCSPALPANVYDRSNPFGPSTFISQLSFSREPTIDTRQSPVWHSERVQRAPELLARPQDHLCYGAQPTRPFPSFLLIAMNGSASPQAPTATVGFTSIIPATSATRRYDCSLSACS